MRPKDLNHHSASIITRNGITPAAHRPDVLLLAVYPYAVLPNTNFIQDGTKDYARYHFSAQGGQLKLRNHRYFIDIGGPELL